MSISHSVKVLVAQSCLTLCEPMDYSLPGSSVHGVFQTRTLEWVVIPFSRGSSWPRDWIWVSHIGCRFFTFWTTREAHTTINKKVLNFLTWEIWFSFSSVHSVMPDSLPPDGLQHARHPCLLPTPRVYSDSCQLSQWCHPIISSSIVPSSSHLQLF